MNKDQMIALTSLDFDECGRVLKFKQSKGLHIALAHQFHQLQLINSSRAHEEAHVPCMTVTRRRVQNTLQQLHVPSYYSRAQDAGREIPVHRVKLPSVKEDRQTLLGRLTACPMLVCFTRPNKLELVVLC